MAQDAMQVAPDLYSVLFENDRVRLLLVHMKPGDSSAVHSHPNYLVYSLDDGTVTFNTPSGETVDAEMKTGQTMWRDAEDHAATNNGTGDVRALLFELK